MYSSAVTSPISSITSCKCVTVEWDSLNCFFIINCYMKGCVVSCSIHISYFVSSCRCVSCVVNTNLYGIHCVRCIVLVHAWVHLVYNFISHYLSSPLISSSASKPVNSPLGVSSTSKPLSSTSSSPMPSSRSISSVLRLDIISSSPIKICSLSSSRSEN